MVSLDDLDGRNVSGRPIEGAQVSGEEPSNRCMLREHGGAFDQLAVKSRQSDDSKLVFVRCLGHLFADPYSTAKLFNNFPLKSIPRRLTSFDLPPGKFPHSGKTGIGASLGTENLALANDNRANNIDVLGQWTPMEGRGFFVGPGQPIGGG
jgi:hypothetical protein